MERVVEKDGTRCLCEGVEAPGQRGDLPGTGDRGYAALYGCDYGAMQAEMAGAALRDPVAERDEARGDADHQGEED